MKNPKPEKKLAEKKDDALREALRNSMKITVKSKKKGPKKKRPSGEPTSIGQMIDIIDETNKRVWAEEMHKAVWTAHEPIHTGRKKPRKSNPSPQEQSFVKFIQDNNIDLTKEKPSEIFYRLEAESVEISMTSVKKYHKKYRSR